MKKNVKLILGLLFITVFAAGLIWQQFIETPTKEDTRKVIKKNLADSGIEASINDIMIYNWSAFSEAFNITDIEMPANSKILFVITSNLKNKTITGGYVETIYIGLDSDPTIEGVMVMDSRYRSPSTKAVLLFANRTHAEELRGQNLTEKELARAFHTIEWLPPISYEETERSIITALRSKGIDFVGVAVENGSYIKDVFNLTDPYIGNDSKVALIPFYVGANKTLEEFHRSFVDVIYTAFNADPTVWIVIAYARDLSEKAGRAGLVYIDRKSANEIDVAYESTDYIFSQFKKYEYNLTAR